MAVRHFGNVSSPVIRLFIDEEELRRYHESVDWQKESDRFGERM